MPHMPENVTALQLPPLYTNLETQWASIEARIDQIMTEPGQTSYAQSISIYTIIYNYSTSLEETGVPLPLLSSGPTNAQLRCAGLYDKITRYLVVRVGEIQSHSDSLQGEALLRYYTQEWERYTAGAKIISSSFAFSGLKYWVEHERDKSRTVVYPVYTLAVVQWKQNFFLPRVFDLKDALLCLLERQRQGETIDRTLVKAAVDAFLALCLPGDNDNKMMPYKVRLHHLEALFLDAAETDHCEAKSEALAVDNKTTAFLEAEGWLWSDGVLEVVQW